MSADNYAACPKCQAVHDDEVTKAREAVDAAYGKVSVAEFDRMREKAQAMSGPIDNMLREDYEIGIEDGTFYVDYRAVCETCRFTFAYKHSQEPK